MEEKSKEWFELVDQRKRPYARKVWIPVYELDRLKKIGNYPESGHIEDMLIVDSAVIFCDCRKMAKDLDWLHWPRRDVTPFINDQGEYCGAENFLGRDEQHLGFRIVLKQYFNSLHPSQVFLHQDFIHAYGLMKEDNRWLRPNEGYEEVVRLTENSQNETTSVEIRAEYLRDYLAARNAALRINYFRKRDAVFDENPNFAWPDDAKLVSEPNCTCEVHCSEIDESGHRPGTKSTAVKVWRTDVDTEADVPEISQHKDGNIASKLSTIVHTDKGIKFFASGTLRRVEWIEPANESRRMRGSEPRDHLYVVTDGSGGNVDLATLNDEDVGKYLWFNPGVVPALLTVRGSKLIWYTESTGGVSALPDSSVHFGVNELGLVNAYAYDIARRPLWERRIWTAHNCRPDGGVSRELTQSQVKCEPAESCAPELLLKYALESCNSDFQSKFEHSLLKDHPEVESLFQQVHRFRAIDETGLRALAKDVVRVSIERIDKKSLVKILREKQSKLGTLKLFERLLGQCTDKIDAKKRLLPLFGVNELRNTDAHLRSRNIEQHYSDIGVDRSAPLVAQAAALLSIVAKTFYWTGVEIKKHVCNPD